MRRLCRLRTDTGHCACVNRLGEEVRPLGRSEHVDARPLAHRSAGRTMFDVHGTCLVFSPGTSYSMRCGAACIESVGEHLQYAVYMQVDSFSASQPMRRLGVHALARAYSSTIKRTLHISPGLHTMSASARERNRKTSPVATKGPFKCVE